MVLKMTLAEVLNAENLELGTTEWHRLVVPGDAKDGDLVVAGGIQPNASVPFGAEFDPFMIMTAIPQLSSELLKISDASATVIVGMDEVRFISSFTSGTPIRLKAVLLSAQRNTDGYVIYKLALAIEVQGQLGPAWFGEVSYMSGNP